MLTRCFLRDGARSDNTKLSSAEA